MKKIFCLALSSVVLLLGSVHAQTFETTDTTITSITVPATVPSSLIQKVTKVAPAIMSVIDNNGGYGSAMHQGYVRALEGYVVKFTKQGDSRKVWIAETLLAYAAAYYDEKGKEVVVVEVPIEQKPIGVPTDEIDTTPPTPVVHKDYTSQQEELDDMKALWKAQNLRNYGIIQQLGCFCTKDYTRPMTFDVENGRVEQSSGKYANGARESVETLNGPKLITIDGYFAIIQSAINDNVASLHVEYHPQQGYPTTINIDYNDLIVDEEKFYTIKVI